MAISCWFSVDIQWIWNSTSKTCYLRQDSKSKIISWKFQSWVIGVYRNSVKLYIFKGKAPSVSSWKEQFRSELILHLPRIQGELHPLINMVQFYTVSLLVYPFFLSFTQPCILYKKKILLWGTPQWKIKTNRTHQNKLTTKKIGDKNCSILNVIATFEI
jgi:hypothetical protein